MDNDNVLTGKERFEELIAAKRKTTEKWKNECVGDMSDLRKAYLHEILAHYDGIKIPFSHFNKYDKSKHTNELIYPVICAYHLGYFNVKENYLEIKNTYLNRINKISKDILDKAINKIQEKHPEF